MTQEKKALLVVAACLVVIAFGFYRLRDREAPAVVTRERIRALQESIENWASEHGGKAPETLEAMGLDDEAIRDHAGNVFEYTVGEDGTVTLVSYGADGKPGGHMFHADTEVSFPLPETEPKP